MHRKLAGHLPLQDMIDQTIRGAQQKLAASEKEDGDAFGKESIPKKMPKDKKKDEEKEKKSHAIIDADDPDDIEKLASALDSVADDFIKEADSVENGGESSQGGMQLPTMSRVSGHQSYKKDGSKKHQVPMSSGLQSSSDGGGATQMPNDAARAPGGAPYAAKGVLKTAFALTSEGHKLDARRYGAISKGNHELAEAEDAYAKEAPIKAYLTRPAAGPLHRLAARHTDYAAKKHEGGKNAYNPFGGLGGKSRHEQEKKSSAENPAVGFILSKIAESAQGGESPGEYQSGQGPKPSSDAKGGNDARKALESNSAATNMKKVDGKVPQKRMLSEVLTEPALTSSTDSKVQENLRNASKGGVKIAAAKALLQKIASDPNDPRHEKLKEALEKKKGGKKEKESGMGMMSPMMSGSMPPPSGM